MATSLPSAQQSSGHDPEPCSAGPRGMDALEEDLAMEVRRLAAAGSAPARTNGQGSVAGHPLPWWRARLAGWLNSDRVRGHHPGDLLEGLGAALGDFDEGQLRDFIQSIAESESADAPEPWSRRPGAGSRDIRPTGS